MDEIKKEKKELLQLELVPNVSTKSGRKRDKKRERHEALLKEYFSHQVRDFYEEKQVGDKWYVKMYNGGTDKWQVAVFSNESFRRYKTFQQK